MTRLEAEVWNASAASCASLRQTMRHGRRIGPLAALFHVGKLIAQAGDPALAKAARERFHEGVRHSRTRAMGEDEAGARCIRTKHKRRDRIGFSGCKRQLLKAVGFQCIQRD